MDISTLQSTRLYGIGNQSRPPKAAQELSSYKSVSGRDTDLDLPSFHDNYQIHTRMEGTVEVEGAGGGEGTDDG
jgi:hypothetical protein